MTAIQFAAPQLAFVMHDRTTYSACLCLRERPSGERPSTHGFVDAVGGTVTDFHREFKPSEVSRLGPRQWYQNSRAPLKMS